MGKDPAFLFYFQDFLVGTEFMETEAVGCYIRILCHLADKGKLTEKHMQRICRGYAFEGDLKKKFQVDKDGYFFNKRLADEVLKRKNYTQSRRENAKGYAEHMEDVNEDVNEYKYLNNKKFSIIYLDYISMRKTIRKPATEKARKMALTLLHKHPLEIAIKMLEQSVMNSWQGIFPLKQDKFNKPSSQQAAQEYKHFDEK